MAISKETLLARVDESLVDAAELRIDDTLASRRAERSILITLDQALNRAERALLLDRYRKVGWGDDVEILDSLDSDPDRPRIFSIRFTLKDL